MPPCEFTRRKARSADMDVVLFNDKVTPQVCKMLDYKHTLYDRFVKEVLEKNIALS